VSATVAACGSPWASRSTASALHNSGLAVLFAGFGEGLLGALNLAEAHQGLHQPRPRDQDEVVRCGQVPGHPLGGPEGGQRVDVAVARHLEPPAGHRRLAPLDRTAAEESPESWDAPSLSPE
jgi:hypothetical protein